MKTKWIVAALAAMVALLAAGCDNGSSEPEEPGVVYKDGWLLAGSTVRQYRGAETSVTTPEGVTRIGEHAFENCTGITEVTIRDGVTVIDDYAFYGCENLAAVTVPASVALIGDYAFYGCALETVRYGGTVGQWCAVDGIGSLARAEHVSVGGIEDLNGTAALEIPDGTKTIAADAFYYCESLTDVTVPASVTRIGGDAFRGYTALKALRFTGTTEQWRAIEGCGTVAVPYIQCSDGGVGVKDAPAYLKLYGTKVTRYADGLPEKLVIPDGVTEIGSRAFEDCKSLLSVEIPASVTSIEDGRYGSGAFSGCTNLTSVTIGDGMTSIGDYAFYNCKSLASVTIPDGVKTIGEYAFRNCTNLTTVTYLGTLAQWCAVDGVSDLMSYADSVTMGDGTDLKTMPKLVIPDGVTEIGEHAFYDCASLASVTIPDGVTVIDDYAFSGCKKLERVEIPASVALIGSYAFSLCEILKSVTIPGSVTVIGDFAFQNCTSLTEVKIPGSVTDIGEYAFSLCKSLKTVEISDGVTSIKQNAFWECTSLESVKIPASVESIGDGAFSSCFQLKTVEIPGSVTSIGDSVFYYCSNLASVTIPASVKTIGYDAFDRCYQLKTVTYEGTTEEWKRIEKGSDIFQRTRVTEITCTDGTVTVSN